MFDCLSLGLDISQLASMISFTDMSTLPPRKICQLHFWIKVCEVLTLNILASPPLPLTYNFRVQSTFKHVGHVFSNHRKEFEAMGRASCRQKQSLVGGVRANKEMPISCVGVPAKTRIAEGSVRELRQHTP